MRCPGRRDRVGGPPSPLPRLSQHASRTSGYIGLARPRDVSPSFEFVLSDLCLCVFAENMSRTVLGSLCSVISVGGEDALRREHM